MEEVERSFRDVHGQAVATLTRIFGDLSLAEDAVQDAFTVALERWPRDGIPRNPSGWVVATARNRAIDILRRDRRGHELLRGSANDPTSTPAGLDLVDADLVDQDLVRDDQLRLIFTCCHPALRPEHQVALTLRLIAGLRTVEVAQAFLVSEETMTKRLVRAKYKIAAAQIPYRVPREADLPDRLQAVLTVVCLVHNAGLEAEDTRALRAEAIRLARMLLTLMPEEHEVAGLLALLLLSEARVPARWDGADLVLLRDQDRSGWDHALIAEGQGLVLDCLRHRRPGPFALQAAIQAIHCAAATYAETDWATVVRFYDRLLLLTPTPVVALNRAVAISEVDGAAPALALLEPLQTPLANYHPFHAARGSLLERLGRAPEAADAYALAADLVRTKPEHRYLSARGAPRR